jgi:hypothetical protein
VVTDSDVIVEEVNVRMKPPKRSAISIVEGLGSSDGGYNSHCLLQITRQLPFQQWILDITGPQLNVFDPCIALSTYMTKYVDLFRMTAPLGTAKLFFDKLADTEGLVSLQARIDQDAVEALAMGIREWQTRSSSNIPELLRQSGRLFRKQQQELLTAVEKSLNLFVLSADYASELSPNKQYTMADFHFLRNAGAAVFSEHEA